MLTGHDVRNIGTQLFQAAIEFPLSLDVHSSLLGGQHLCVATVSLWMSTPASFVGNTCV